MNARPIAVLVVVCLGVAAGGASVALGRHGDRDTSKLPNWIRVAGMDMSGRDRVSLANELRAWKSAWASRTVELAIKDADGAVRRWRPTKTKLGGDVDVDKMVEQAFAVVRSQGFWSLLMRRMTGAPPIQVQPAWRLDEPKLRGYLKTTVHTAVMRSSRPARLVLRGGTPSIAPESPGIALDMAHAVGVIRPAIADVRDTKVDLRLMQTQPAVRAADVKGPLVEVGSFSTHYSERGNRRRNLELACSRINGTVLKPGDVFSYNAVVGPREAEAGFRMAPVIIGGRLEPGMGGGVCQVSTTLYNAALLADLQVVSRSHHGFPVHYVPPGRDATVAYGSIDLKLRNSTDGPIGIWSDGSGGRVRMRLFGTPRPGRKVEITRTGVSSWPAPVKTVNDPSLPLGARVVREKGHAGHRVTVWRTVIENGKQVRREVLSRDTYRAFPTIVAVGTGHASPAPAAAQPSATTQPPAPGPTIAPPPLED